LTCPDDVNQWFWGGHLAHVSHAGPDSEKYFSVRIICSDRPISNSINQSIGETITNNRCKHSVLASCHMSLLAHCETSYVCGRKLDAPAR
jgi:hypothetical protein